MKQPLFLGYTPLSTALFLVSICIDSYKMYLIKSSFGDTDRKWRLHYIGMIITGNELFPDKEDANHEELLLALLNKNFDFQRPSSIGKLGIYSVF